MNILSTFKSATSLKFSLVYLLIGYSSTEYSSSLDSLCLCFLTFFLSFWVGWIATAEVDCLFFGKPVLSCVRASMLLVVLPGSKPLLLFLTLPRDLLRDLSLYFSLPTTILSSLILGPLSFLRACSCDTEFFLVFLRLGSPRLAFQIALQQELLYFLRSSISLVRVASSIAIVFLLVFLLIECLLISESLSPFLVLSRLSLFLLTVASYCPKAEWTRAAWGWTMKEEVGRLGCMWFYFPPGSKSIGSQLRFLNILDWMALVLVSFLPGQRTGLVTEMTNFFLPSMVAIQNDCYAAGWIQCHQLIIMLSVRRVVWQFGRNIVRRPRTVGGWKDQKEVQVNKDDNGVPDVDFEEDIQPLSYNKEVQEKLKVKVAEEIGSYQGEDPSPNKLVNRPSKGAAWGLGGQLMLASKKVELEGLKDDIDSIIEFLELQQVKNIYVHDFFADNSERRDSNRRRYHILGSCFSAKHCWKVGTETKNAFNTNSGKTKLYRQEYDPIYATLNGGKSEEWVMVTYKDYEVSLMTEEQREAMDLEWKWNNPVSQQTLDKHIYLKIHRKGRKRQFEDLDG